jgi:hypothetical protein
MTYVQNPVRNAECGVNGNGNSNGNSNGNGKGNGKGKDLNRKGRKEHKGRQRLIL